jgi:hypothetical protein
MALAERGAKGASARRRPGVRWTAIDVAVMSASLAILLASLAGLVWLLRR